MAHFIFHLSLQSWIIKSSFSLVLYSCLEHSSTSHFTFQVFLNFKKIYQGGESARQGLAVVMCICRSSFQHCATLMCLTFSSGRLISLHYSLIRCLYNATKNGTVNMQKCVKHTSWFQLMYCLLEKRRQVPNTSWECCASS